MADVDALEEGRMLVARAGEVEALLCKVDGHIYAVANRCTHGMAKLGDGQLKGHVLSCPLHQGRFDVRSGACLQAPPVRPLATLPVRIDGQRICIIAPTKVASTHSFKFGPLG